MSPLISCYATITKDTDLPYWVPKGVFISEFSQKDFLCRDSEIIKQYYLSTWFYISDENKRCFLMPTVNLVKSETEFINGRHRAAVLFNVMDNVPMAFAEGNAQEFAKQLSLEPLQNGKLIELPNLPIIEHSE